MEGMVDPGLGWAPGEGVGSRKKKNREGLAGKVSEQEAEVTKDRS